MSRLSFLSCALLLVSCGADNKPQTSTSNVLPAAEAPSVAFPSGAGEALGITAYRQPTDVHSTVVATGAKAQAWSSEGETLPLPGTLSLSSPTLVDVQGDHLWFANASGLQAIHLPSQQAGDLIALPEGTQVSAIEVGFQGTVFVGDRQGMQVLAVVAGKSQPLWSGPDLGRPQALLLNGGSLLIGTDKGITSFNIKSGTHKFLSQSVGSIIGLAHDHLGYFIALRADGTILRVQGDGTSRELHKLAQPGSGLAFDLFTRTLYVASQSGVTAHDYLELTGEDKSLWARRDARPMKSYRKHGMTVAGGEYWPSHGTTKVKYPDDILWGFYPSPEQVHEGSAAAVAPPDAAIACAEASYRELQKFVEINAPSFHQAAELTGASKQFYLWVNDYSGAAQDFPHEQRASKFWYWQRDPAVTGRVPGFWKWETTLMQDGSCSWPQAEQIEAYLSEKIQGAQKR